jgi:hypothetical protein
LAFPNALAQVEQELGGVDVVTELVTFIRTSSRGISALIGDADRREAA